MTLYYKDSSLSGGKGRDDGSFRKDAESAHGSSRALDEHLFWVNK